MKGCLVIAQQISWTLDLSKEINCDFFTIGEKNDKSAVVLMATFLIC